MRHVDARKHLLCLLVLSSFTLEHVLLNLIIISSNETQDDHIVFIMKLTIDEILIWVDCLSSHIHLISRFFEICNFSNWDPIDANIMIDEQSV